MYYLTWPCPPRGRYIVAPPSLLWIWRPCLELSIWWPCLELSIWRPCLELSIWRPCLELWTWRPCSSSLLGSLCSWKNENLKFSHFCTALYLLFSSSLFLGGKEEMRKDINYIIAMDAIIIVAIIYLKYCNLINE